jgi:hypothetical protein
MEARSVVVRTTTAAPPNVPSSGPAPVLNEPLTLKVNEGSEARDEATAMDLELGQVPNESVEMHQQQPAAATTSSSKPTLAIPEGRSPMPHPKPPSSVAVKVKEAIQTAKKSVSMEVAGKPRIAVMSPITMCFERMLGAGTSLIG